MDKSSFTRYLKTHKHYSDKKVKSIELKVAVENLEKGEVYITDLQLQDGSQVTGEIPNTREILKNQKFDIDESHNAVSSKPNVYLRQEPKLYENVRNRFFNIANRGHSVFVVPNVHFQDYRQELVTTGLDLTLYPKDDYDFLRISTNYGDFIQDEYERTYQNKNLANHPLNRRYTREFCFPGGKVGDEIKLSASSHSASINGKKVPLGVRQWNVGSFTDYDGKKNIYFKNRQRFMAIPWGSYRIRIEFYKRVKEDFENDYGEVETIEYMKDTGIGYWGFAEFTQWAEGVSKF